VPSCAPHHANRHVGDDPTGLMYADPLPSDPDEIDPGNDDSFDAGSAACYDVAKSPFLEPLPAGAVLSPSA